MSTGMFQQTGLRIGLGKDLSECLSGLHQFQLGLLNIRLVAILVGVVMVVSQFNVVKVCRHLKRIRFLFRDERYEFLRCERCGQIVRLPLAVTVAA